MMTAPHICEMTRRCHAIQKSSTQPVATNSDATGAENTNGDRNAPTAMNAPMRDRLSSRGGWPTTRRSAAAATTACVMLPANLMNMTASGTEP